MRNKVTGIYKITSPSKKIYIGESVDIFKYRYTKYLNTDCKEQSRLYHSIKKYGWENHTFEVIEECEASELKCRERYWQDFYDVLNKYKGLNCKLTECGELKSEVSEETKDKISKALTGKLSGDKNPMWGKKGELNPNFGRQLSEKQKESMRGERPQIQGENNPFYGKKHSEETKCIIGEKSRNRTKESNKKISDSRIGKYTLGDNSNAKMVLHTETGIFYASAKEASITYNINYKNLTSKLTNRNKNNTSLIYV